MNKRELEILKIGFEAGKKAIEMHPDDDEYDTIRLDEARELVKNLTIPRVSGSDERWVCQKCGELVDGRNVTFEEYHEGCGGRCNRVRSYRTFNICN